MEPITITFTPTVDDYLATYRAALLYRLRQRVWRWIVGVVLIVVGSIATLNLALAQPGRINFSIIFFPLTCFLTIAGLLIFAFVTIPGRIRRQFRTMERLRKTITWELSDEGLMLHNEHIDSKMDWGTFLGAIEMRNYYLLVLTVNPRNYQFIPRRAFTSPEHEAAFRALVEKNLGPIKK